MPESERPETLPNERARRLNHGAEAQARVDVLERAVVSALRHNLPRSELVPLLRELVSHAPASSEVGFTGRVMLAETIIGCGQLLCTATAQRRAGWECARVAKEARCFAPPGPARARCWAISGLAYSLLGHYRSSRYAYYQALKEDPDDAVCAHNLGHLLDTRLNQPKAALRWLRQAYCALPSEPEVAASYAYALVRCAELDRAVDVLAAPLGSRVAARAQVQRWWAVAGTSPAAPA